MIKPTDIFNFVMQGFMAKVNHGICKVIGMILQMLAWKADPWRKLQNLLMNLAQEPINQTLSVDTISKKQDPTPHDGIS